MPFHIVHNDITKMNTDAIVNSANPQLRKCGGVSGAIFEAAGEIILSKKCNSIGYCGVGDAVITRGYQLKAKYIIHAVGPVWTGGSRGEDELLAKAYNYSLELAKVNHINTVSFPLISSGHKGYPRAEAFQIAVSAISEFLLKNEMDIYLVVLDRKAVALSEKLYSEITYYMDSNLDDFIVNKNVWLESSEDKYIQCYQFDINEDIYTSKPIPRRLDNLLKRMDETFSEMLLRLVDEKGKTDIETYKKANIDRKLFSKIRSQKNYQPSKNTALALVVALELSLDEALDLLMKAGYTLSSSNKFDVIIKYFIDKGNYDIYIINETLFYYEQQLLGN